jgi:hypothetical protein
MESYEIYVKVIDSITLCLARMNPKMASEALAKSSSVLDSGGVEYGVEGGRLIVRKSPVECHKAFYEMIIDYLSGFEARYGVNKVWKVIKTVIVKAIVDVRDFVRHLNMELPVSRYQMDHNVSDTLFGVSPSDFRHKSWSDNPVTLTNKRLIVPRPDSMQDIPLQKIGTIGREVYVGYTREAGKGIMRAVDFQAGSGGVSCAIFVAHKDLMDDFLNTLKVLRAEQRRLDADEAMMLERIYKDGGWGGISRKSGMSDAAVESAFSRLLDLGYVDSRGHITSAGINIHDRLFQAKKMEA